MRERLAAGDWRQVVIDVVLYLCLLPFWLVGLLVGVAWAIIVYTSAAVVAGFKAGAGG